MRAAVRSRTTKTDAQCIIVDPQAIDNFTKSFLMCHDWFWAMIGTYNKHCEFKDIHSIVCKRFSNILLRKETLENCLKLLITNGSMFFHEKQYKYSKFNKKTNKKNKTVKLYLSKAAERTEQLANSPTIKKKCHRPKFTTEISIWGQRWERRSKNCWKQIN